MCQISVCFARIFQGRMPVLEVADAEFLRHVMIKDFTSFTNRRKVLDLDTKLTSSLLTIKDDHWKHVRSLLTPTFTSGKLKQVNTNVLFKIDCCYWYVKQLINIATLPIYPDHEQLAD